MNSLQLTCDTRRTVVQNKSPRTKARLSPVAHAVRASIIGLGLAHGAGQAATIQVTTNHDDGSGCTLREAIISINSASLQGGCINSAGVFGNDDRITFASAVQDSTITLTADLPDIRSDLIIAGFVNRTPVIDGQNLFRVFAVLNPVNFALSDLTVYQGRNSNGGAVRFAEDATGRVSNCNLIDNSATSGGGVRVQSGSSVSISNSTISGNSANFDGGVSIAQAELTLDNVIVRGNSAAFGGGIGVFEGSITLENSTVSENFPIGIRLQQDSILEAKQSAIVRNSGRRYAGGILLESSSATLTNSTVSNNLAGIGGGVFLSGEDSVLSLINSTVSSNTSTSEGGGIGFYYLGGNSLQLVNSLIVGNQSNEAAEIKLSPLLDSISFSGRNLLGHAGLSNQEAFGDFLPQGDNVVSATSDGMAPFELTGIISPLMDSIRHSANHALPVKSPAIDAGDQAICESLEVVTDQRGRRRNDGVCDVGAYEFESETCFVTPTRQQTVTVFCL